MNRPLGDLETKVEFFWVATTVVELAVSPSFRVPFPHVETSTLALGLHFRSLYVFTAYSEVSEEM